MYEVAGLELRLKSYVLIETVNSETLHHVYC